MPSAATDGPDDLIAIAVLGKAHGIRGDICATPFGSGLESLEFPCELRVGVDAAAATLRTIDDLWQVAGRCVCRFEGIADRNEIETLRGQTIFCERSRLPAPSENEFYHFELVGMTVLAGENGAIVGRVREVHNYPTVDALDVEKADGSELMLPMTDDLIKRVDTTARTIVVHPESLGEV